MPETPFTLPVTDPVLIVAIAMTIFLVAPLMMQRIRVPGMIGIILAGAVIGPHGLNLLARSDTIVLLGTVGLLYLMFIAGIEIDLHEFRRNPHRSVIFGAFTFFVPQGVGTVAMLALGFDVPTSILIGSMFASHTLVAYPLALRFGIGKNAAVTTTVGGTIITDTAALLVLAVIAASTEGALDAAFWIRLALGLVIYVTALAFGLPRLGRWFFRSGRTGAVTEYVFVFAALFTGAYLAEVAGIEPVVGAALAGLAMNRLIPDQSLLANRIHFVGEAIFIPFFLLSVGMLVDARVLLTGTRAWEVMLAMTVTVVVTKWLAARATAQLFGYSSEEAWTIFGLSVPHASATLAVALIGVEIGLFDDLILNGTILMILVTVIAGPPLVEKYGRRVALQEEQRPYEPGQAPQRILVPMAKPATADDLMDLALLIRDPNSAEPIYPLTVFPASEERSSEFVTMAEKMLSHAVAYAAGADVPVMPLTRMDHNFANGIARGIAETRTTTVIVGWDGKRSQHRGIFGSVLDQLLDQTKQQVVVARLGHPLNTTRRIVLLVPQGSDHTPGYLESVRTVKLMANRLGASIRGFTVSGPAKLYQDQFAGVRPDVPLQFEYVSGWNEVLEELPGELRRDDLVVVLSARRRTIAWNPALERLPARLSTLVPESFLMVYASEAIPASRSFPAEAVLPSGLSPHRVLFDLQRKTYRQALRAILATEFAADTQRLRRIEGLLTHSVEGFAAEIRPGVVVPHARLPELTQVLVFLGISNEGVPFPLAEEPARLIFIVLTPEDEPGEHLDQLAEIANLVGDPVRFSTLVRARSKEDLMQAVPTD